MNAFGIVKLVVLSDLEIIKLNKRQESKHMNM